MNGLADTSAALVRWLSGSGRTLDVREETEPWPVLVAEVMSQQTQIERVGPALRSFVTRWRTPADLAGASTRDVIEAWAGLGYNRRALALREAAKAIVAEHGGRVPADLDALLALPGVGPYTARAVLAVAYGRPVAPIDVNVRRVVGRLLGDGIRSSDFQAAADAIVDRDDPRRWTWAVMDLAASVGTRRNPRCDVCPASHGCASAGTVGETARPTLAHRVRFERTNRWLRGAILRELRGAPPRRWVAFDRSLGEHPPAAVTDALVALEREGFVERAGHRARIG